MALTINDIYRRTLGIERRAAMMYRKDDGWADISVAEFGDTVRHVSTALRALGVKPDDRVAILSENRPEWTLSDFAILAAGGVTVPIYNTLLAHQIEYIINDSGSAVVLVSDAEQLAKIEEIRPHCACIREVIVFNEIAQLPEATRTFRALREEGRRIEEKEGREAFDRILASRYPDDLATIVYTSGTTGDPKGAMLTHGNIASNVVTTSSVLPFEAGYVAISILPLSHIFERMADFTYFYCGGIVAYAENVQKVPDNLREVKPQVFVGVPRLFEKMQAKVVDTVAASSEGKQKIFRWALKIGQQRLPYRLSGEPLPGSLKWKAKVADRLVFNKIREGLGGRVQFILSGGAPLSSDLAAFFIGAGIEIFEGYGLTETSPVITVNTFEHRKIGTVGKAIPGVEVKIASDGEILTRGPHVMKGYFNKPASTAQAIDEEGWFHTGDIGELDSEGYLRITDRKKDLIINAYGKNIAPQPLENLLKTSPYFSTVVLIGDRRKFLAALIVPNFERLEREVKAAGIAVTSPQQLVNEPKVRQIVQSEIDRFNASLDRQEQIRRFMLLPRDFSIEQGEITPSLKVKRKAVDTKYKELIDSMYADEGAA